ncbi:hypothetical protein O3M35_002608 [Rhynocoris fuscipes]|uniref:MHC class I antigen n=1 Tax=Rhynocoris fuscipes TaxID=488301 RepID=A0AAW1CMD9_9HEMI
MWFTIARTKVTDLNNFQKNLDLKIQIRGDLLVIGDKKFIWLDDEGLKGTLEADETWLKSVLQEEEWNRIFTEASSTIHPSLQQNDP